MPLSSTATHSDADGQEIPLSGLGVTAATDHRAVHHRDHRHLAELDLIEHAMPHARVRDRFGGSSGEAFAARHDGAPGGRVIVFTSGQYHSAMPAELPYVASKAALHELTASLAAHLMPRRITVNCIDPGPNDTGYATEALHAAVRERMPGGRWGTPADTAKLVAWLLSDEAEWVTGQTIASDGGWSVTR